MSREYQAFVSDVHADIAADFSASPVGRHVEVEITDRVAVYLFVGDDNVQIQTLDIPDAWERRMPTDATIRRYIHRYAQIGRAPITEISS